MEKEKIDLGDGTLENKKKKKRIRVRILSILLVLVLLLGSSYAFFTLTKTGEKQNIIKIGKLSLSLSEGIDSGIKLENAVPTTIDKGLSGTPYHFSITNDGTVDANYNVYLDNTGTIEDPFMFYYALKKNGKIIVLDYLNSFDVLSFGVISPGETVDYDLYIWLDYNDDGSSITSGQYYQGTIRVESTQQRVQKLSDYIKRACDGTNNCMNESDGFTYFKQNYYGSDTTKKYIWYSGKLWLVTGYDSDGNVESWLNEEFLPTLDNYQKYLVVDYSWNYSTLSSTGAQYQTPIGKETIVKSPVGLLNTWDVFQASDGDNSMTGADTIISGNIGGSHYYLGNANLEGKVAVAGSGLISYGLYELGSTTMPGVTPSVVFNKNAKVASGIGTKENPYLLDGTISTGSGYLLNSVPSGSYVALGNGLNYSYRISRVENGLTKVTSTYPLMVKKVTDTSEDYNNLIVYRTGTAQANATNTFYYRTYAYLVGSTELNYDATSKNYPLAYFLNQDFLGLLNGYFSIEDLNFIATNRKWYLNSVSSTESYKNALGTSGTAVTATVGLPSLAERSWDLESHPLVSSTNGGYRNMLMTHNGTQFYYFNPKHTSGSFATVIPSFYLKENVVIKSGRGTKNDPYILRLANPDEY